MTRFFSLIALATLVLGSDAQAQEASPPVEMDDSLLKEHYLDLDPESPIFELGDYVSPIQQILHNIDQAAYENWLIFIASGNFIDWDAVLLHRQVRDQVADREKLLLLLRYAELISNHIMHRKPPGLGSPQDSADMDNFFERKEPPKITLKDLHNSIPSFFRERSNLEMLRKRVKFTKQLHRELLVYSRVANYRDRFTYDPNVSANEHPKYLREGHPASFLSMETRGRLEALGYPINSIHGTTFHALTRPSHLELRIDTSDKSYSEALKDAHEGKAIDISTTLGEVMKAQGPYIPPKSLWLDVLAEFQEP